MRNLRTRVVARYATGTYHCVSRCVRRAFVCGDDALTGRNFDRRKRWLEDRLLEPAEVFSVSMLLYAVMSNHLHVVLLVDAMRTASWPDEEIADRWVRVFPATWQGDVDHDACRRNAQRLCANPDRLSKCRGRLGDLSWFMRCLAASIARRANLEDRCTVRFWEGRFKCEALLGEAAALARMTQVDLNPARAGIASNLSISHYTSIHR